MSFELVVGRGIITLGNVTITGSLITPAYPIGSVTASLQGTSSFSSTASFISSANIVGSIVTSSYSVSSSYAINSNTSTTSSFASIVVTASYASNITRELTTGSTYLITSSQATTSSYSLSSSYSVSSSNALYANLNNINFTGSNATYYFTLVPALSGTFGEFTTSSLSANMSTGVITAIGLTSSLFGTSSWSSNSITSSYTTSFTSFTSVTSASYVSGSPGTIFVSGSIIVAGQTTSSVFGTSSWANVARTSSMEAAWGYATYTGLGALNTTTYNCAITRSSPGIVGQYWISFTNPLSTANYAVISTGFSGSSGVTNLAPTASYLMPISQRTTGFTMSVVKLSAAVPPASDFNTASFSVFSY